MRRQSNWPAAIATGVLLSSTLALPVSAVPTTQTEARPAPTTDATLADTDPPVLQADPTEQPDAAEPASDTDQDINVDVSGVVDVLRETLSRALGQLGNAVSLKVRSRDRGVSGSIEMADPRNRDSRCQVGSFNTVRKSATNFEVEVNTGGSDSNCGFIPEMNFKFNASPKK